MRHLSKRIFLILVIAVCILCLAIAVLITAVMVSPSTLRPIVEAQIGEITGQEILVEDADLDIFWPPRLSLIEVQAGKPDTVYLNIERIEAEFSLRKIFVGKVELTGITFIHPSVYISTEMLSFPALEGESEISAFAGVIIEDGYLRLNHAGHDLVARNINGLYAHDGFDLSAEVLGGTTEIHALNRGGWKGNITSEDIDLSGLGSRFTGICNVDSSFDLKGTTIDAALDISLAHLGFPWSSDRIDWAALRVKIAGESDRLEIRDLSVMTPVADFSGGMVLEDPGSGPDTLLTLSMESTKFDYERLEGLLPAFDDLPWLEMLLSEQIRSGESRFSEITYSGRLGGLADAQSFFSDAYIVQDLIGQSFGSGFGPERITDITGKVIYGKGGVLCKGLSGMMNGSVIENVNLRFMDVAMPVSTTTVEVTVDIPAKDFIDTWRAAVVEENARALLSAVSDVGKGRIRGKADVTWDDTPGTPVRARGDISVKDCTYSWGGSVIEDHSGTVGAESYESPVSIAFTGRLDNREILRFDMTMEDPFGRQRSSFYLQADRPLEHEAVTLLKGSWILFEGKGIDGEIDAAVTVKAEELSVLDTVYRPAQGMIAAKGRLKGRLWPSLDLHMTDLKPELSSGSVTISADIQENAFRSQISGALDLMEFIAVVEGAEYPLKGSVTGGMIVEQGEHLSLSGSLECENAVVYSSGRELVVDGPVAFNQNVLTSSELNLTSGGKKIRVTSGSLDMGDRPYFTGGLFIEGVGLGEGSDELSGFISALDMDAAIELKRPNLYGIALDSFRADARLRNGKLHLSDMVIKGISGTAHGTASTDLDGKTGFDLVVSLKNAGIRQFFYAVAGEDSWVHGNMDLEGHLWGSTDSINGTLAFTAREGNIRKYALFSRIFALLNIYRIIQTQNLELTSKNFPYNVISSTFTIRDSIVSFDDFYLDSNAMQLSAVGLYSLKTKEIDAHIGIQPFETVDRAIGMIPLLGWVLTGEDKKLIVVSMKVRGELDDPVVQVAPVDTISNPVRESLFRFMKIPSNILEKSREILPKNNN